MWAVSVHTSWASALTSSVRILSRVKVCSTATNLGHMQEHLRACGESGHFTWFTYLPTPLIALCFPWKHVAHALPWTKAARWLYVGAQSPELSPPGGRGSDLSMGLSKQCTVTDRFATAVRVQSQHFARWQPSPRFRYLGTAAALFREQWWCRHCAGHEDTGRFSHCFFSLRS